MKCSGEFVFKGLEKRDGGEFTNERGQVIKFNASYSVKVDEMVEGKVFERKFKFADTKKDLANKFLQFNLYAPIVLTFDVVLYNNVCRLDIFNVDKFSDGKEGK